MRPLVVHSSKQGKAGYRVAWSDDPEAWDPTTSANSAAYRKARATRRANVVRGLTAAARDRLLETITGKAGPTTLATRPAGSTRSAEPQRVKRLEVSFEEGHMLLRWDTSGARGGAQHRHHELRLSAEDTLTLGLSYARRAYPDRDL